MKILMPVEVFYPSQAGGPANSVHYLTKHLDHDRFETVIVATDKGLQSDVPRNKWLENERGRVKYVKTRSLNFPLRAAINSLINIRDADVVHTASTFFPTAFISAFAACLLKKKIVVSPRGEFESPALRYSRGRKRPILWLYKRLISSRCVFHSTNDTETENIIKRFGPKVRIVQIPNYIEMPDKVERCASKTLLFVGRVKPIKAIDSLLKALSLSKSFLESEFTLTIAGRGPDQYIRELKQLAKELGVDHKVSFVGQVEATDKDKLFADAYWTILPSHSENFGHVVLESLSQNTPVIASKGTPWRILEDENVGFWTENTPESLAEKIDQITTMTADEYEKYRERGRAFVEEKFDIRKNVHHWDKFYSSLCGL